MESQNLYYNTQTTQFTPEKQKPNENFVIEDLLNFSNEEEMIGGGDTFDSYSINGNGNCSSDSSTVTVIDSCCSGSQNHHQQQQQQQNFPDSSQLSDELCVPYDDIAELEWLSNFVEESFSSEDMQKLQLISGIKPEISQPNPIFRPAEMSVPGKARTKRSRSAPCNWSSRLLHLSHSTPEPTPTPTNTSSSSESDVSMNFGKKTTKFYKKKEVSEHGDGRKCLHCGSDKTPQWRTGPLGPKTLCNACGVRFKSGRLVPEYRPAASPTFVLAKHSNSHRKVMELRRKKEMMRSDHEQFLYPNAMYGVSGGDYLVHRQTGSGFTQQLI